LSKPSNAAQQLIGAFAPKLVELTDRVLFDDIWERKELSPRSQPHYGGRADCIESPGPAAIPSR